MPGQEKMVMDFYKNTPSAVASLRGNVYEEKIINLIKSKAKPNLKNITKEEAEKILKKAHDQDHNLEDNAESLKKKKTSKTKEAKATTDKAKTIKKVSKK